MGPKVGQLPVGDNSSEVLQAALNTRVSTGSAKPTPMGQFSVGVNSQGAQTKLKAEAKSL